MHSLWNILATAIRVSCVFAVLLLMNPVKANEQKIETINLDQLRKIG